MDFKSVPASLDGNDRKTNFAYSLDGNVAKKVRKEVDLRNDEQTQNMTSAPPNRLVFQTERTAGCCCDNPEVLWCGQDEKQHRNLAQPGLGGIQSHFTSAGELKEKESLFSSSLVDSSTNLMMEQEMPSLLQTLIGPSASGLACGYSTTCGSIEIAALKREIMEYNLKLEDPTITSTMFKGLLDVINVRGDYLTKLQRAASLRIQFEEVPPDAIAKNEILYERIDASKDLAMVMLNGHGRRFTPICDDMFGSGKTALVYKFRSVLNSSGWSQVFANYDSLRTAVYLHIPFAAGGISGEPVQLILAAVRLALTTSCSGRADFLGEDFEAFRCNLRKEIGTTKFLFHFDDVGCYKPSELEFGATFIDKLWEVGGAFRRDGHFFVMTGRSTLLRLIGTWALQSAGYSSPDKMVMIPLPPLSKSAVEAIMIEHGVEHVLDQAEAIHTLTGGVPRAVYIVVTYFKTNSTAVTVEKSIEDITRALELYCSQRLMPVDRGCFQRCLELSWAGTWFTNDTMLNGEPITSVIARLGIFRQNFEINRFQLLVPRFIVNSLFPTFRSMCAISQYVDNGDLLESGCRRILLLRFSVASCSTWTDAGLPFLTTCNVPFPKEIHRESFSFPKIVEKMDWTEENVLRAMDSVHNARSIEVDSEEFAISALPTLIKFMKIGHYYLPLAMACSANALLKCSESDVVNFQFISSTHPIADDVVDAEAKKCLAIGYNVYLVVVSTSGNVHGGDYVKLTKEGVTVVVLSRSSVETFLGQTLVTNTTSITSIGELTHRIACNQSP